MNYAFYISGNSTRLYKFLIQASMDVTSKVKLIVSDYSIPDNLQDLLNKNKIKCYIIDYKSIDGNNNAEKNLKLSNGMLEIFKKNDIDYCISFGSHILSGALLECYKNKLINFHPAILPMYPGINAIDQAIKHGNTFLVGNTVHFIDSGVDTGKIIMQSVIPLQSFFDNNQKYDCILDLQIDMLNKLICVIDDDRLCVDESGNVKIVNANYNRSVLFPEI